MSHFDFDFGFKIQIYFDSGIGLGFRLLKFQVLVSVSVLKFREKGFRFRFCDFQWVLGFSFMPCSLTTAIKTFKRYSDTINDYFIIRYIKNSKIESRNWSIDIVLLSFLIPDISI